MLVSLSAAFVRWSYRDGNPVGVETTTTAVSLTPATTRPVNQVLDRQKAQWENANVASYSMSVSNHCAFCLKTPIVVVVEEGVMVSATVDDVPFDEVGFPGGARAFTVTELFDLVENRLPRADGASVKDDLEYGFPNEIFYDQDRNATDDEFRIQVTNFQEAGYGRARSPNMGYITQIAECSGSKPLCVKWSFLVESGAVG